MAPLFPLRRMRRGRARRARPQTQIVRHTERLEDRTLLAAFAVSTELDTFDVSAGDGFASDSNGATSLRAAIQEANALAGDDVIILPSGTYTLTRTGLSEDASFTGDLDVTSNLVIQGAGAGRTFIDANDIDRVLDVRPGAKLLLSGVTIRNGAEINAAGIRNAGTLELKDSIVTGNDASGASNSLGGGIGNTSGTLTLSGVTVSQNTATVHGGGLYSSGGTVTITESTFSTNSAISDGGGISIVTGSLQITGSAVTGNTAGTDGGGLSADAAVVTVTETTVIGNTATDDAGGLNVINSGQLRIFDSTITNNIASGGFGGGIRSFQSTLGMTRTTVSGNQSTQSGGGVDNDTGIAEIIDSLIAGNSSTTNGGGLNNFSGTTGISNSTVSGNTATTNGGGIQNADQSNLTLVNSTITANTSTTGSGGGINNTGLARLGNSIIASNTASTNDELSGAFSTLGNNLIRDLGSATGLTNQASGDLVGSASGPVNPLLSALQDNGGPTLSHALLAGSPAIDAGNSDGAATTDQNRQPRSLDGNADGAASVDIGAVEYRNGTRIFTVNATTDSTDASPGNGTAEDPSGQTSLRAAIQEANALTGFSKIVIPAGTYQLSLTGTEGDTTNLSGIGDLDIAGELTIEGAGQDQTFIDAGNLFRVLQIHSGSQVTIRDLTIQNGQATFGGGVHVGAGTLTLKDVTITRNTATGSDTVSHGGGISLDLATLILTGSTINENTATVDGGGLYATNSVVQATKSTVSANTATASGGGVGFVNVDAQFSKSTISGNSATDDGGGAAFGIGSLITLDESTIDNNSSQDFGGGIHVLGAGLTILNSTLSANFATSSGGALNNEQGSVQIGQTTLHSNTAAVSGGAIDNFDGTVLLKQATVSGNTAGSNGGGIVNFSAATLQIVNSTITGNTAAELGGGLWSSGTVQSGNSIIAGNTGSTGSPDINGSVASLGTNLIGIGDGSSGLVDGIAGNLVGTTASPIEAGLSPLRDNGGDTLTHLPLFGSAAIDRGTLSPGTAVDQRGHARSGAGDLGLAARSDIGAVEFIGLSLSPGQAGDVDLTASREGDAILITDSASGTVLFRIPLDEVDQLQFNGSSQNDSVIVNLATGNPLPVGGIEFNGGTDGSLTGDSLILLAGSASTVDHDFSTGSDGTITVDGRAITYAAVEGLADSINASERSFLYGDGLDTIVLANSGAANDGTISISRTGGALVDFLAPTSLLKITDNGAVSVVRFDSIDDVFGASVSISTGTASDQIDASILTTDVTVASGSGNDTVITGSGNDNINTGAGNDVIEAGAGNDNVFAGANIDTLRGGDGDDTLLGQGGSRDVLIGGAGDDILHGGGGLDYVRENGNTNFTLTDTTLTGLGNDILINIERAGLTGGSGNNRIDASAFTGPTTLEGGDGNDVLIGGSHNDKILDTGSGNDRLEGNAGSDILIAGRGRDTALGGDGNDFVLGNGGSGDQLSGGAGADVVNGGGGTDILFETFDTNLKLRDTRLIGEDIDKLIGIEQARLFGGPSANIFDMGRFSGRTVLYGMGGDDFLIGGKTNDVIFGGDGNDSILGRAGNDTIFGEAGDDTLKGDGGNDSILGGPGNDGITGRTDNDTLSGDEGNDTLVGESGDDVLSGGEGDDTAFGGTGTDTVTGGNGADMIGGSTGGQTSADAGDLVGDLAAEIDEAFIVTEDWIFAD